MAIGLGIGLLLIVLGIAFEFAASRYDTPPAPRPVSPLSR